jgi:hypothetical protein
MKAKDQFPQMINPILNIEEWMLFLKNSKKQIWKLPQTLMNKSFRPLSFAFKVKLSIKISRNGSK